MLESEMPRVDSKQKFLLFVVIPFPKRRKSREEEKHKSMLLDQASTCPSTIMSKHQKVPPK